MWNIIYLATGAFFISLLAAIFFSKKIIDKRENRLFKLIMISNIIGYVIEMPLQILVRNTDINNVLIDILCRFYLVSITINYTLFTIYVFAICLNKNNPKYEERIKKISNGLYILEVFVIVALFLLPFEKYYDVTKMYIFGSALDFLKLLITSHIIIYIILLIKNHRELKNKKYLPIYFIIMLLVFMTILNSIDPSILITNMIVTFVCYTMYFTIENPDLLMLNELYKNRELMEAIYEDKYNFLFEMTQEARNPIKNISLVCNEIKNSNISNDIKKKVDELSVLTRQLDFSINKVLNISSMDIQKIKIMETKYDILKVCEGIEINIKDEVPENVKFNMELPKQVPTLYGDYMKLRQILYSLINNACKKTTNGSISLKLNTIEKYDVCRLIFNISDTGPGMSLEVINDILGSTGELSQEELKDLENKECNVIVCKKIARILGGNLMIKSNAGQGTDIVLTLDQRVYHDENTILDKYKKELSNSKRVLIVSQDKKLINSLKNKMSSANVISSVLYYGGDVTDRIKSGKEYNFILVDDEMSEMSGYDTFKALHELKVKMPIVIMLKNDKERLKKHYLEDGFDDCLLVSNLNAEINRLIDKY